MNLRVSIASVVLLAMTTTAHAAFSLTVYPSSAPNFFGSPSWSQYGLNAVNSIENGLGDIGNPATDPTAYAQFSNLDELNVTNAAVASVPGFWQGDLGQSSPFDQERGNRIHFGLHIVGDGSFQFQLDDVCFKLTTTDGLANGSNGLLFSEGHLGQAPGFSDVLIGIDYGPNNTKGGGDDIRYDNPADDKTSSIDELVYVGVGNAYTLDPANTQAAIDAELDALRSLAPIDFTGGYELKDPSNPNNIIVSGSSTVILVPEPTSIGCLAIGLTGFVLRRRRRLEQR